MSQTRIDEGLDALIRTAQASKALSGKVAGIAARYAEVLARTYVAWDPTPGEQLEVAEAIADLAALPGRAGYVTDVFCTQARYFHPDNGARIPTSNPYFCAARSLTMISVAAPALG